MPNARKIYAKALYLDDDATLDDLREAVAIYEDVGSIAQRVLGSGHPIAVDIEDRLRGAREILTMHVKIAELIPHEEVRAKLAEMRVGASARPSQDA